MQHRLIKRCSVWFICTIATLLTGTAFSQAFKFAELTGSPVNTRGWGFQGAAFGPTNTGTNTGNSEIVLTTAVRRVSGAIFFNTPINLSMCNKWVAEYEFRIAEGSGADGIAFCYLENPPVGFVNGGGLGVPADANGLKVAIDTWYNECENQMPKLQIRWGLGYKECEPTQPTYLNNANELNFIRDGKYHTARITYDKGNITFSINGKQYLTAFQTFNFVGYFGFTASTGNSTDLHSIRNAKIFTDMPDITLDTVGVCSGASAPIGPNVTNPLYAFTWTPATNLSSTTAKNPVVSPTNNATTASFVKYYLTTANTSIPGCNALDSQIVKVFPRPAITYAASRLCTNDTVTIIPSPNWTGAAAQGIGYTWRFNDPARPGAASTVTGNPGRYRYAGIGNYVVDVTTTTADGCAQTDQVPVALAPLPTTAFTVLNPNGLCINEPVVLVNRTNNAAGTVTRIVPNLPSPTPLITLNNLQLNDTVRINYRQLGIPETQPAYIIGWANTNGQGCTGGDTATIRFLTQPKPQWAQPQGVCLNVPPFALTGGTETGNLAGTGFYSGRGVANGIFNPVAAGVGSSTIYYVFDAANGCSDTVTRQLPVFAQPVAEAGPDKFILPGGSVALQGSASVSVAQIVWSPSATLTNANTFSPLARPTAQQAYELKVTTAQGCADVDSVTVRLLPALKVPTAFTPHRPDGVNDLWNIPNLNLFPEAQVLVFDRYGREVYKSKGYPTPWDGKINGVMVPVGVYYYIIDTRQGDSKLAGSITIL